MVEVVLLLSNGVCNGERYLDSYEGFLKDIFADFKNQPQ